VNSGSCEARKGYLSFVSHELNNSLATALWSAELLGRMAPADRGGERGQKLALAAHRAAQRLARLIEDHMTAERLAVGGLPIAAEDVPLGEALAAAQGAAGGADVDAPAGIAVRADRALLVRALEGMLAAASRGGARARAEARRAGAEVTVTVRGAPLAPADLELPRKGSPSDTTGRSLSLVMAAAVAEAHGGSLRLEGGGLVLSWPAPG
jgi:signal transduction histidine kinase